METSGKNLELSKQRKPPLLLKGGFKPQINKVNLF